ncbi:MAG: SLBB domain-containing protein [Thermodesulfobacteriota bacterium]
MGTKPGTLGSFFSKVFVFLLTLTFILTFQVTNAEEKHGYTIAPGDLIEITVFEAEELNQKVRVGFNGQITFPLLGQVKVSGLTPAELEYHLENLLGENYLHSPQIKVFIKEAGWFFVGGAVKNPGSFPYRASITLNQAIAQAGGFEDDANKAEIQIIRETTSTLVINIGEIIDGRAKDFVISRNDTIYIKKAGNYFVNGYVRNPGAFQYKTGITLTQAIAQAGGTEDIADTGRVRIIKATSGDNTETKEAILVSLKETPKNPGKDIEIREGDTIFVPKNHFKALWKGLLFNVGLGSIGIGKKF